jgi:hypothetical protein
MLTLPSFAHMPAPIPRCFCAVLLLLSSRTDGGLRRFRIGSTVTLPVSRLARRSIFILACVLADPAMPDLLHRRLRALPLPAERAPVASGWSSSCRGGYLPPTGRARSFHGALGIWVKSAPLPRIRIPGGLRAIVGRIIRAVGLDLPPVLVPRSYSMRSAMRFVARDVPRSGPMRWSFCW